MIDGGFAAFQSVNRADDSDSALTFVDSNNTSTNNDGYIVDDNYIGKDKGNCYNNNVVSNTERNEFVVSDNTFASTFSNIDIKNASLSTLYGITANVLALYNLWISMYQFHDEEPPLIVNN